MKYENVQDLSIAEEHLHDIRRAQVKEGLINLCKSLFSLTLILLMWKIR
jgi:hypothetical protein